MSLGHIQASADYGAIRFVPSPFVMAANKLQGIPY